MVLLKAGANTDIQNGATGLIRASSNCYLPTVRAYYWMPKLIPISLIM